MATVIEGSRSALREERFFFIMACIMVATIVGGFSLNLAMGRSSFSLPLIFHIHAFVFFSWTALYLVQNFLVSRGAVAVHRKLGWLAMAYVPAMLGLGTAMTIISLRRGGPPFFDQNEFLFGNLTGLFCFGGLAVAAIVMRRRTDWHRRLMFSGMTILTGPGLGRLLPMPFLIPWAWWAAIGASTIFIIIGMRYDARHNRRVHPAWIYALAVILGTQVIADVVAYSSFGISTTERVIAGTPGAARGMAAFFPK